MTDESHELTTPEAEAFILSMTPVMKEFHGYLRERLPEGTNFAIIIEVLNPDKKIAQVLAHSTDREIMATRAAEWAVSVWTNPDASSE